MTRTFHRRPAHPCRVIPALVLALCLPVESSEIAPPSTAVPGELGELDDEEVFLYRWSLGGFKGTLARLIVPGRGDASLRTGHNGSGRLVSELYITSPKSRHGEFWRYGAEIDTRSGGETLRAWTAQFFRGKGKAKCAELAGEDIIDITSSIRRLRNEPSFAPTSTRMWAGGKIYAVRIESKGEGETRLGGRLVATRSYTIRGAHLPGGKFWKGRLELILVEDEASTPVKIVLAQGGVKLRLELAENRSVVLG